MKNSQTEGAETEGSGGWRSMGSAPVDRERVILWLGTKAVTGREFQGKWIENFSGEERIVEPLYWMPIPDCP